MKCPGCGSKCETGVEICPLCGTAIPNRQPVWLTVVACIAAVIGIRIFGPIETIFGILIGGLVIKLLEKNNPGKLWVKIVGILVGIAVALLLAIIVGLILIKSGAI